MAPLDATRGTVSRRVGDMPTSEKSARRARVAGDLTRPVRVVLVVLFLVLAALGMWYGQHQNVNDLSPTPGVWPRWVFWPCLVLLALILTQLPRRWPKRLRQGGAVLAILVFLPTAIVADAAIGAVAMNEATGVVNSDTTLRRSMHRVNVAVDGRALNAVSPAASFAGGQDRNTTTGTKHYRPGTAYAEARPFAQGEQVRVLIDPDGSLYPRVVPGPGQSGYLPWFTRSQTSAVVAGLALLLGWAWILVACVGVVARGPIRSLDD